MTIFFCVYDIFVNQIFLKFFWFFLMTILFAFFVFFTICFFKKKIRSFAKFDDFEICKILIVAFFFELCFLFSIWLLSILWNEWIELWHKFDLKRKIQIDKTIKKHKYIIYVKMLINNNCNEKTTKFEITKLFHVIENFKIKCQQTSFSFRYSQKSNKWFRYCW